MHLFYTPDIVDEIYYLNEEESKHCVRVLRRQVGDIVHLVDGKGSFYVAEVLDDHPKKTKLKILEKKEDPNKWNYFLHMAVAPTKNIARIEWFLEKATEIGIDEISFIECRNSERDVIKTERLNKVVTAAMKQSLKAFHPVLNDLNDFQDFIKSSASFEGKKFIAHCREDEKQPLWKAALPKEKILILIGPEGDFTEEEINMASHSGFLPISLGRQRFRTETAALVACHTISIINEL